MPLLYDTFHGSAGTSLKDLSNLRAVLLGFFSDYLAGRLLGPGWLACIMNQLRPFGYLLQMRLELLQ